jgi:hypothetical protein
MLLRVQLAGSSPRSMAAFSAGMPNESQPMACITCEPRKRWKRANASPIV